MSQVLPVLFVVFIIRRLKVLAFLALAWHPTHERLIMSGGNNGSLIYWTVGESTKPHTIILEAHRWPPTTSSYTSKRVSAV